MRFCRAGEPAGSSVALKRGMWICLEEVLFQLPGDGISYEAGARLGCWLSGYQVEGRGMKGVGRRWCGHQNPTLM